MNPSRRFLGYIFGALILCAGLAAAWKIRAATPPKDVELLEGIVFGQGGGRDLKLDITRPRSSNGNLPVLLCIHGGGWTAGSRADMRQMMFGFSQAGVLCASVEYRLTPKDRFPAQIEDVKCAVRWLRANAEQYRIDQNRIAALGVSAGAHLAALLATTAGKTDLEGTGGNAGQSSAVSAAICFAGPYDLTLAHRSSDGQRPAERDTVRQLLPALLGGTPGEVPDMYRRASPITHASKSSPPMLLVHGAADPLVLVEQAEVFDAKLREAGASVQFLRLPDGTHDSFGSEPEKAMHAVADYVRKQLKVGAK